MKFGKQVLALILSVVMLISCASVVLAEDTPTSGKCGDNAYWKLEGTTLRISGLGEMYDYSAGDDNLPPWYVEYQGTSYDSGKAYFHGSTITKVIIEEGIESIGIIAFFECVNLKEIILPETLKTIRDGAFSRCPSLKSITIPAGVTYIEDMALLSDRHGGFELFHVDKNNQVYSSDENGILYSKDMTRLIQCPRYIQKPLIHVSPLTKSIDELAFYGCDTISKVYIPDSVETIGERAFENCVNIEEMVLSNNLSALEMGVIYGSKMKRIVLPVSVKRVAPWAFGPGAHNITDVYYTGSEKQWNEINFEISDELVERTIKSGEAVYHPVLNATNHSATIHFNYVPGTPFEGEQPTDPVPQPSTDPVTQPSTDPVTQPSTDPVTNPSQEPTGEEPAQPDSGHVHDRTVEKIAATFDEDGEEEICCEECGYTYSYRTIPAIASVKLSTSKYGYDGKQKKPKVVVRDRAGNELKEGKDYTVKYSSGRKKIGKYNVRVTFQNDYKGTKKLSFRIIPGKVRGLKATAGKKFAKLKWNAVKGATNYVVYFATKKNGTFKKAFTTRGATAKVMKLKSGKTYYFRVRAIAKLDSGTFNGNLSAIQKAKIK